MKEGNDMAKNNRVIKGLFSLILSVCLTGCKIVYDVNTFIESTGGKVELEILIDEELYGYASEDGTEEDAEFKPVEVDGETMYRMDNKYNFSTHEAMEKFLTEGEVEPGQGSDDWTESNPLFETVSITRYEARGVINSSFTNETLGDLEEGLGEEIELEQYFSFTFPDGIDDTNGELSEDKKTATWSMKEFAGKEIYAKGTGRLNIFIWVLLGLVVAAVLLLFVRKDRKKVAERHAAEAANNEAVAETLEEFPVEKLVVEEPMVIEKQEEHVGEMKEDEPLSIEEKLDDIYLEEDIDQEENS